jgi:hypothetical protein
MHFRTRVDLYDNVRYIAAIVNRTGIADMDPIEDAAKPAPPESKKKAKQPTKPKAKKRKAVKPKKKAVRNSGAVVRSERLDMRLSKAEKARITAKAKKTRRTVTSLVIEAIEKIR